MTAAEILGKIRALSPQDRSQIYEALKDLVLRESDFLSFDHRKQNDIARAARALRADYEFDSELTVFTALDGEDFHASR
jgi:hypothetical protein